MEPKTPLAPATARRPALRHLWLLPALLACLAGFNGKGTYTTSFGVVDVTFEGRPLTAAQKQELGRALDLLRFLPGKQDCVKCLRAMIQNGRLCQEAGTARNSSIGGATQNSAPAIYAGRPVETEPCNPDKDSININPRWMTSQFANVVPELASILAHEWCHAAQPLGLTEDEAEKPCYKVSVAVLEELSQNVPGTPGYYAYLHYKRVVDSLCLPKASPPPSEPRDGFRKVILSDGSRFCVFGHLPAVFGMSRDWRTEYQQTVPGTTRLFDALAIEGTLGGAADVLLVAGLDEPTDTGVIHAMIVSDGRAIGTRPRVSLPGVHPFNIVHDAARDELLVLDTKNKQILRLTDGNGDGVPETPAAQPFAELVKFPQLQKALGMTLNSGVADMGKRSVILDFADRRYACVVDPDAPRTVLFDDDDNARAERSLSITWRDLLAFTPGYGKPPVHGDRILELLAAVGTTLEVQLTDPTGTQNLGVLARVPTSTCCTRRQVLLPQPLQGGTFIRTIDVGNAATTGTWARRVEWPVVINEFRYDDGPDPDDREFVELYNASSSPVDIGGFQLESADAQGPNRSVAIPGGTVLQPGQLYLIGADLVRPGQVHLVIGVNDLWEDDTESLTLRDATGAIVDTVTYEAPDLLFDADLAESKGFRPRHFDRDASPTSVQRVRDGYDLNLNGRDFFVAPPTPGMPNYAADNLPRKDAFDAAAIGDPVASFRGTSAPARVIDPTVVDPGGLNPSAIPPSPQGGNAAVFGDPAAAGNAVLLDNRAVEDAIVEALCYVDATAAPAAEGESWSVGLRGAVDADAAHADPTGGFAPRLGRPLVDRQTGVAAVFQRSDQGSKLYLCDFFEGGNGQRVLGEIAIVAGVNDGWQRFRLEATGDRAELSWGTSSVLGTVSSQGPGGVYFAYRNEFVAGGHRPLTLDDLSVRESLAEISFFGLPTAHTFGPPAIGLSGIPRTGSTIAITGRNLVPSNTVLVALGFPLATPLPLGPLGGLPGSHLLLLIADAPAVPSDPRGELSLPLVIPPSPALVRASLSAQLFDLDRALRQFALPFGHSRGMTLSIGD